MEEENKGMDQGNMGHLHCGHCGMCGMHGHHRHGLLKMLLGLLIIVVVFFIGVKVGEFKTEFRGGFGGYGRHGMMNYQQPMMYRFNSATGGNVFYGQPGTMMQQATTTPAKK